MVEQFVASKLVSNLVESAEVDRLSADGFSDRVFGLQTNGDHEIVEDNAVDNILGRLDRVFCGWIHDFPLRAGLDNRTIADAGAASTASFGASEAPTCEPQLAGASEATHFAECVADKCSDRALCLLFGCRG